MYVAGNRRSLRDDCRYPVINTKESLYIVPRHEMTCYVVVQAIVYRGQLNDYERLHYIKKIFTAVVIFYFHVLLAKV